MWEGGAGGWGWRWGWGWERSEGGIADPPPTANNEDVCEEEAVDPSPMTGEWMAAGGSCWWDKGCEGGCRAAVVGWTLDAGEQRGGVRMVVEVGCRGSRWWCV